MGSSDQPADIGSNLPLAQDSVAANAQLRLALESPDIILFSLDRSYRYVAFNRNHADTMNALWGVEIELGVNMLEAVRDSQDRIKAKQNFDRALVGEEFTLVEEYGDEEFQRSFYEVRYSPTVTPEGEIVGVTVLCADITTRIRATEAERLESLGLLAGQVAHDFSNLLVGILGSAALARKQLDPASPIENHLATIERAAQQATDLTRQLLAYSGKGHFVSEFVDAGDLVRDVLGLLPDALRERVDIQTELTEEPTPIYGELTQLRQLVLNLLHNAADALGTGAGTIRVRSLRSELTREDAQRWKTRFELEPGPYVLLQVEDEGCGMDISLHERIFEPFFTTKLEGNGLGLAAALGVVRAHNGFLQVESAAGEGTLFTIGLPLRVDDNSREVGADDTEVTGHILVIDDEQSVRDVSTSILQLAGLTTESAENGQAGLELFTRDPDRYDAVVLDMSMPLLSGGETLTEIRSLRPMFPAVLMSGHSHSEFRPLLDSRAPTTFIAKPFRADQLVQALRSALRGIPRA